MMIYKRDNGIYSKNIQGKWYFLERNKKVMRELNEVGSFIWGLLGKECSFEDIVKKVSKEFNVGSKKIDGDIKKFIDGYVKEGYIIKSSNQKKK